MLEAVRLLAAGFCLHPEALTRCGASVVPCRFPAGFALIVHRRHGPLLYDTGYGARFLGATRAFPNRLYRWLTPVRVEPGDGALVQLAALGIAAGDVRHVVVSHFHADHVAALRDFPAARIVCSRAAWASVRGRTGLAALRRGFLAELMPADAEARMTFVEDRPRVPLDGAFAPLGAGYDLFGDGEVVAIGLPGHACGQIGLALRAAPGGPLALVGDAAWSHEAYERDVPPPRLTTALLGRTPDYRRTLRLLHGVHRAGGVRIVPAHAPPR